MELRWYIDSWAPAEGAVFVSWRHASEDPWALEQCLTMMIAAPEFDPIVIDRSVAFGAAHRGFQERFAVEGRIEHGFRDLQELIRFVQRIYLGSGPGGGGEDGGAPWEPGPSPADDHEIQNHTSELLNLPRFCQRGSARRLLNALVETMPERRVEKIQDLLDDYVFDAADTLMRLCAGDWNDIGPSRDFFRFHMLANIHRSDFPSDFRYWAVNDRLHWAINAPLHSGYTRAIKFPPKIRTFLDVVGFVAADRDFICRLSLDDLLPLLLATAINFCKHTTDIGVYHRFTISESRWFRSQVVKVYAQFIVDWLPIDPLESGLEETVQEWTRRPPRDQRGRKT